MIWHLLARQRKVKFDNQWLKMALQKLTGVIDLPVKEVAIVFVSDRTITRVNKMFTGRNSPTDVLSFRTGASLADLFISVETAARQAKSYGQTLEEELLYLVLHGLLHLKGFSDYLPQEYTRMKNMQDKIMLKIKNLLRFQRPEKGKKNEPFQKG